METTVTDTTTTKTFSYTEADVERLATPPRLKTGMFELATLEVDNDDNAKSHDMQILLTNGPVDENGQAYDTPSVGYFLGIPLKNPRVPGHTLDKEKEQRYVRRAEKFIRAVAPDYLPKWFTKNSNDVYVTEEGQPITRQDSKDRNLLIKRKVLDKLIEWYTNPALLMGVRYYAMVTESPDTDFSNIFWVTNDPKETEVVRTDFSK